VWITYDAGAANAAPEWEMSTVTDSTQTGTTVVVAPGWTTTTASGDRYAISKGGRTGFQLPTLISAVNRAIRDAGRIVEEDATTVDTAAAKTEYALPSRANYDLRQVWIQSITNDANDNQWYLARNWYIEQTATDTGNTLVFQEQPPYPRDVKLVYLEFHPKLNIATNKLNEQIHWERVIYKAAYYALAAFRFQTRSMDDYLLAQIDELLARANQADLKFPVKSPRKTPKIMSAGYTSDYDPAPGENKIP